MNTFGEIRDRGSEVTEMYRNLPEDDKTLIAVGIGLVIGLVSMYIEFSNGPQVPPVPGYIPPANFIRW